MERYATQTRWNFNGPVRVLDADGDPGAAENGPTDRDGLLFTAALHEAHNAPDTRKEKIQALKAAIATGTYRPDAKKIALALIREEAELFY